MADDWKNTLYYGDNLDILRRYVRDETVDLVYLDPPFNSNQSYNVLFAEHDGARSAAQIRAFEDTWRQLQSAPETALVVSCETAIHDQLQLGNMTGVTRGGHLIHGFVTYQHP